MGWFVFVFFFYYYLVFSLSLSRNEEQLLLSSTYYTEHAGQEEEGRDRLIFVYTGAAVKQ